MVIRIAEIVLVMLDGDNFAGWLRWGLFWDEHPFMNLLYLLEPYRGKGLAASWCRTGSAA